MIEFVWLNQVKEIPAMTNMITLIHVEDNKVILEQDWAVKIKLTNENIEWDLAKDLETWTWFIRLHLFTEWEARLKRRQCIELWALRKIDDKGYKFKSYDVLLLHFEFHSLNKLEDELLLRGSE